jgi:hypothetical protein
MAAISGDDTKVSTNARTPAHLESIETANFETGDLAWVESVRRYYMLDKLSKLTRDGVNVLYTLNSAPRFNGGQSGPGRWVVWVPNGPPGPTGPAGATGATGATGPAGEDSASPYEFVFRPGQPNPSGNVYDDWATLVADAAAFPGDKLVYFNDDLAPLAIPAGTWDFGPGTTTLRGSVRSATVGIGGIQMPTIVTAADGAFIVGVRVVENLAVQSQNTSSVPVFDVSADSPSGVTVFFLQGLARLIALASGPVLGASGPMQFIAVALRYGSIIGSVPGAGPAYYASDPATTSILAFFDASQLPQDSVGATGTIFAAAISPSAQIDPNQPDVPGGVLLIQPVPLARLIGYDQSLPPFIDADTVQAAIDRLKSLPAQTGNLGPGVPIGAVDTPVITLPALVAPTNGPVDLDASLSINDPAPGNDVNFFFERSLDGGATWLGASTNYVQTTLPNNTVAITSRDFVAPGSSVIYRVTARANSGAPVATAGFMRAKMTVEGP